MLVPLSSKLISNWYMTPRFANCSSTTLPWWKLALSVCLNHASCRQALACNWRCLCPGQPVPLSTTLPWWKLALSVCLSHACSLSSDVIASCRQAMACKWRCLCPGQPVPLSTIFFGRDLRIQHVDIVKKVHLFLLCLAQAVLVFQLWLIASCRQAIACNWGGGKGKFKERLACLGSKPIFPRLQNSCGLDCPCPPFSQRIWQMLHQLFHPCMSKNPCRSFPSHTNAETNAFWA